jgi:hypothetical protein
MNKGTSGGRSRTDFPVVGLANLHFVSGFGDAGGAVEIERAAITESGAFKNWPVILDQKPEGPWNIAGTGPDTDPALVDPKRSGVFSNMAEECVKIAHRVVIDVSDGDHTRGSD